MQLAVSICRSEVDNSPYFHSMQQQHSQPEAATLHFYIRPGDRHCHTSGIVNKFHALICITTSHYGDCLHQCKKRVEFI